MRKHIHIAWSNFPSGLSALPAVAMFLSGCAAGSADVAREGVRSTIEARSGATIGRSGEGAAESDRVARVRSLLAGGLSDESVVQLALLNSPSLQIALDGLGISRAELFQGANPANPVAAWRYHGADLPKEPTGAEFSVEQDLVSLLLAPLRVKQANGKLELVKLRLADAILQMAAEAKWAFYEFQAAEEGRKAAEEASQGATAAAELARRQRKAGNISALEEAHQQVAFQEIEISRSHATADSTIARARLNQTLGLSAPSADGWAASSGLRPLPQSDPPLDKLESLALDQRLDLQAARAEPALLGEALTLARMGYIPELRVGVVADRRETTTFGPAFEISLPVFERRQYERDRISAEISRSRHSILELELAVRTAVQIGCARLAEARDAATRYGEHMVPLREKIVARSQERYNFMLTDVYRLILAKQAEIGARQEYRHALRDYWIARADLERAVGGRLPETQAGQPQQHDLGGTSR